MTGLRVINILIKKLDVEGIYYCHWKSNQHLHDAMVAATDLDILVEKSKSLTINRILSEICFKHFAPTSFRMYPAIENYLSFDEDTGRLIHLHLHYQLTVGEKHLKGYHLPWEYLVLSTRQFDAEDRVYVADPNVEMLLLLVRVALKFSMIPNVSWINKVSVISACYAPACAILDQGFQSYLGVA